MQHVGPQSLKARFLYLPIGKNGAEAKSNLNDVGSMPTRSTDAEDDDASLSEDSDMSTCPGVHRFHTEVDASRWCVDRNDLDFFEKEVLELWENGAIPDSDVHPHPEFHSDRKIGPSIYQVTEHYIKPTTAKAGGMSWALMRHPKGLKCNVFATHCWAEGVFEFLSKVRRAWPIDHDARGLYCCFLANPQNGRGIEWMLEGGLSDSPFARALKSAKHFLVIPNNKVSIYSRLWCVFEANLAVEAAKAGTLKIALPSTVPQFTIFMCSVPGLLLMLLGYVLAYFLLAPCYGVFFQPLLWMLLVMVFGPLIGGSWRCVARRTCSPKVAAGNTLWAYWSEMFLIGHGLGLAFWHFRGFANDNVVGWRVARTFEHGEGWACLPLAFSCVLFYISVIIRRVSRSLAQREGNMINFTSVREARCTSSYDETRIKAAIAGQEDLIDRCIGILSQAGKYDQALLRNIENGMSARHAREGANPFRVFIAVWCWEYWWVTDLAGHAHHIYAVEAPVATCVLTLAAWYFARDHAVFAFDMLFLFGLIFVAVSKIQLLLTRELLHEMQDEGRAALMHGQVEPPYISAKTLPMQLIGLSLVVISSIYHYSGFRKWLWGKLPDRDRFTSLERRRTAVLEGRPCAEEVNCLLNLCEEGSDFAEEFADIGDSDFQNLVEAITPRSRCDCIDSSESSSSVSSPRHF